MFELTKEYAQTFNYTLALIFEAAGFSCNIESNCKPERFVFKFKRNNNFNKAMNDYHKDKLLVSGKKIKQSAITLKDFLDFRRKEIKNNVKKQK